MINLYVWNLDLIFKAYGYNRVSTNRVALTPYVILYERDANWDLYIYVSRS